jgi:hypothetical protein
MEHAVALTVDHLPQGALPLFHFDVPREIWTMGADGSYRKVQTTRRWLLQEHELTAPTAEELRAKFLRKLIGLAFIAECGGIVHSEIRNDTVLFGEERLHVVEFCAMLVPDWVSEDTTLLTYRSMAMNFTTPNHLSVGDLEEDFKNMLIVHHVMEN